jgi:glutamyl-Q tRNA(Asp) synthetase
VYRGRFAPSPTGPLHAGSLVAALASWLDARSHGGQWLVRIEDVDTPRCVTGADQVILGQLASLGLVPDEAPVYQSRRSLLYQEALDQLIQQGLAYACRCSRKDVLAALTALGRERQRGTEWVYPGTCREAVHGQAGVAWRLRTDRGSLQPVEWPDRRLGQQSQHVEQAVGDFPLKRADGCFTYQLAVVVDDARQGINYVVRGEDLADNTARQILLQRALHLPTPIYLHTPLVLGDKGEKLSKQNGAQALDTAQPVATLQAAARVLGLATTPGAGSHVADALAHWLAQWRELYNLPRDRT